VRLNLDHWEIAHLISTPSSLLICIQEEKQTVYKTPYLILIIFELNAECSDVKELFVFFLIYIFFLANYVFHISNTIYYPISSLTFLSSIIHLQKADKRYIYVRPN
jgi:hypothetical protein